MGSWSYVYSCDEMFLNAHHLKWLGCTYYPTYSAIGDLTHTVHSEVMAVDVLDNVIKGAYYTFTIQFF